MRKVVFRGKVSSGAGHQVGRVGAFTYESSEDPEDMVTFWHYVSVGSIDPSTVGEWTGLNDKSGVGIYEGDWVTLSDEDGLRMIGIVVFHNGTWWCEEGPYSALALNQFVGSTDTIEIVGDIHRWSDDKPTT